MKLIVVSTIVAFLIGIVVIIIVVPIIFHSAGRIWKELLKYSGVETKVELNDIELAIVCSNLICNSKYDRSKNGCPLTKYESNFFVERCEPWLKSKNLYTEVCVLPSLFELDPCRTVLIPINVSVKSSKDSNVNFDKIKKVIDDESEKLKSLNVFKEDKRYYSTVSGYLSSFLWSGLLFDPEREESYELYLNSIIMPENFVVSKTENSRTILLGNYYVSTYIGYALYYIPDLGICSPYDAIRTLISGVPSYFVLTSSKPVYFMVNRAFEENMFDLLFCPGGVAPPFYFRVMIEDEYDGSDLRSYNYFIRFISTEGDKARLQYIAYYLRNGCGDPNAIGLIKEEFTLRVSEKKELCTNKGKIILQFVNKEIGYSNFSMEYKRLV
ncbi:MAG: hypothetical protein QXL14_00880 [Candidatus Aenigmatarchaeota archaeon]